MERGPSPSTPYQRPWWLLVNKSAGLTTTIQQESRPGERVFLIQGEPLVQGLGWLTWGPAGALTVILTLVGLAIAFGVNQQSWLVKGVFISAFLALPALAWAIMAAIVTKISVSYVQAERQAGAQQCTIRLNQTARRLTYQSTAPPGEGSLDYQEIRQARVAHPIGGRDSQIVQLTLETVHGPLILLNEALGNLNQKMDLAQEIQQALQEFRL
jgi:hypothetical protein